jgi:hypothetical protein
MQHLEESSENRVHAQQEECKSIASKLADWWNERKLSSTQHVEVLKCWTEEAVQFLPSAVTAQESRPTFFPACSPKPVERCPSRWKIQIHEHEPGALLVTIPVHQYAPEALLASEFGDIFIVPTQDCAAELEEPQAGGGRASPTSSKRVWPVAHGDKPSSR